MFQSIDFNQLAQAMSQMGIQRPMAPSAPAPPNPVINPVAPPAPPAKEEDPKVKYAMQLAKMKEMGFENEEENLKALTATHGIIDAAIERLINMIK
jgi:ubiquilin